MRAIEVEVRVVSAVPVPQRQRPPSAAQLQPCIRKTCITLYLTRVYCKHLMLLGACESVPFSMKKATLRRGMCTEVIETGLRAEDYKGSHRWRRYARPGHRGLMRAVSRS